MTYLSGPTSKAPLRPFGLNWVKLAPSGPVQTWVRPKFKGPQAPLSGFTEGILDRQPGYRGSLKGVANGGSLSREILVAFL